MHYHRDTIAALEHELGAIGFDFILLSSQDKPDAKGRVAVVGKSAKNHEFFRLAERKIGTFSLRYQFGLVSQIKKLRPDIVVSLCHSGTLSEWQLSALKHRLGFVLIAWQCGYEFNPGRLKRRVLGSFVPRFDHHLAYHTNAMLYAISHGAEPNQVTVMHNTINEESIPTLPRDDARALVVGEYPEIGARKIVLFVGAVLVEKRIEVILDAMDIMNRKDVVFMLVGDGQHLPAIRKLAEKRDDVVITGAVVEGVGPYFDAAALYVLPGTGGLGINEAMAHRLPIVSGYADGSADDLVVDGENGFRLRENTAQELAEKMSIVLDDADLAHRMGERSREMITGKFAFRLFIDRIVTALKQVSLAK